MAADPPDEKEQQQLLEIESLLVTKHGLSPGVFPEAEVLRFLRATNHDVKKSAKWLKKHVTFMANFNDGFHPSDFLGCLGMMDNGLARLLPDTDLQGRPVMYFRAGDFYPSAVQDNKSMTKFLVYMVSELAHRADEMGVESFASIVTLEGWSMANFSISVGKTGLAILYEHFPERMGPVYIMHAPFAFKIAWSALAPLMNEKAKQQITVLGNKDLPKLRERFVPGVLDTVDFDKEDTIIAGLKARSNEPAPTPDEPSVQDGNAAAADNPSEKRGSLHSLQRSIRAGLRLSTSEDPDRAPRKAQRLLGMSPSTRNLLKHSPRNNPTNDVLSNWMKDVHDLFKPLATPTPRQGAESDADAAFPRPTDDDPRGEAGRAEFEELRKKVVAQQEELAGRSEGYEKRFAALEGELRSAKGEVVRLRGFVVKVVLAAACVHAMLMLATVYFFAMAKAGETGQAGRAGSEL